MGVGFRVGQAGLSDGGQSLVGADVALGYQHLFGRFMPFLKAMFGLNSYDVPGTVSGHQTDLRLDAVLGARLYLSHRMFLSASAFAGFGDRYGASLSVGGDVAARLPSWGDAVKARALLAAAVAVLVGGGCATIEIYRYQPQAASGRLAAAWPSSRGRSQDLRNVSWSYGEPDPDPSRRAELAASVEGVSAAPRQRAVTGSPLDLSYAEIADGVRMVTQSAGSWTVHIYDRENRLAQLEFSSYAAARLFLDAATALAAQLPPAIEIASTKH